MKLTSKSGECLGEESQEEETASAKARGLAHSKLGREGLGRTQVTRSLCAPERARLSAEVLTGADLGCFQKKKPSGTETTEVRLPGDPLWPPVQARAEGWGGETGIALGGCSYPPTPHQEDSNVRGAGRGVSLRPEREVELNPDRG